MSPENGIFSIFQINDYKLYNWLLNYTTELLYEHNAILWTGMKNKKPAEEDQPS